MFLPASTHTQAWRVCLILIFIISLKKKKISQLFALFSCAKVASALWKYERPWVIFIFSKGKSAKEHFSISGRRKRSKSACLKCSLGEGKNELPMSGGVATAPRFISAAPGVQGWKTNARHRPPLTSWWCLFPVEPTPLQTAIHDDARPAGANFHSGQSSGETCVHSLPLPPFPAASPRNTCYPCRKLVLGSWVPFFFSEVHSFVFTSTVSAAASLHLPIPLLASTRQKALDFRT